MDKITMIDDTESFTVPIDEPQPSQLYVGIHKLRDVLAWFDPEEPAYDPIPVIDGELIASAPNDALVISDGHTRALAAVLAGTDELTVIYDPDLDTLPLATYDTCVGWCLDAGITDPSDLVGRLVSRETYLSAWVERCRAIEHE